jgi:uncharacterized protein
MYVYLHGFASSPQSNKAKDLGDRFHSLDVELMIPDLNQNDFFHLTLTRQIHQVEALFPSQAEPIILIGSSFGGLTAAWVGERNLQVERLVLLAPAFGMLAHWLPKLGEAQLQQWREERSLSVYHYGFAKHLPLNYDFVTDMAHYDKNTIQRPIPTLILHGKHDEVIPLQASQDFAKQRPWIQLIELESDHALGNVQTEIWQAIQTFCHLPFPCV